jgi:hypothetical protein
MGKTRRRTDVSSTTHTPSVSASASTSTSSATLTKKEERKMKIMLKKQRHLKARDYTTPEEVQFNEMLTSLHLRIKYVSGDGNCLFRSIADNLTGAEERHHEFRKCVVEYIEQHKDHFALFMEDEDETVDEYIERMKNPCEWGGHPELYAACQALRVNIIVHQVGAPRFILNCEQEAKRDIHISYHGEVHYNSIRSTHDPDELNTPSMEIQLGCGGSTGSGSSSSSSSNGHGNGQHPQTYNASSHHETAAEMVQNSVPWIDMSDIYNALQLVDYDVDNAIELLIASKEEGDAQGVAQEHENGEFNVNEQSVQGIVAPRDSKSSKVNSREHKPKKTHNVTIATKTLSKKVNSCIFDTPC